VVWVEEKEDKQKWTLYFDGLKYLKGVGIGIVLVYPQGGIITIDYKLNFDCINNMVKYDSLVLRLKVAIKFNVKSL